MSCICFFAMAGKVVKMVAYRFDPTFYEQQVRNLDNDTLIAIVNIYEYLGHRVVFRYGPPTQFALAFEGRIEGEGPDQYEFLCFSNQIQLYMQHVDILGKPGPKHIHIEADSVIPAEVGHFEIPITRFILTLGGETNFPPPLP